MKTGRIIASLAQEKDRDKILELNKLEYGAEDILATRADFAWRYDQNPAGQATIPVIRSDHDEVVGFIWIVPLKLRIKGKVYLAATGTNLVIHPRYQKTFGYVKLIRRFNQTFKEKGIALHFSFVSEKKYRQLQNHQSQTVWDVPLLAKPLNFSSLVQTYFSKNWLGYIIGRAGQLASLLFFQQQPVASQDEITIEAVNRFDTSFDEFWRKVHDKYSVMVVRDGAFLAWRFDNNTGRSYRILIAQAQGQMIGYIVLRCATIRGLKTGLIMDLLVTNDESGATAGTHLIAEAEAYFRAQEMTIAVGLMPSLVKEYRFLRRGGYIPLPSKLSPRPFHFAVFVHDTSKLDITSLSAQNWFITLADYESF